MMMILFHIESLKDFALGSYRETYRGRLSAGTKDFFKKLWAALVEDQILSEAESAEIQDFIDYRNQIAHRIEDMTFDLSRDHFSSSVLQVKGVQYRHEALRKIESYRSLLEDRMRSRYVMSLSLSGLRFESAEKTYKQELSRLARQIHRQFAQRMEAEDKIQYELSSITPKLLERLEPGHPANFLRNGRLSARGIKCCYGLFEYGFSDLAVSYILRLSYKSVRARRTRWISSRRVLH